MGSSLWSCRCLLESAALGYTEKNIYSNSDHHIPLCLSGLHEDTSKLLQHCAEVILRAIWEKFPRSGRPIPAMPMSGNFGRNSTNCGQFRPRAGHIEIWSKRGQICPKSGTNNSWQMCGKYSEFAPVHSFPQSQSISACVQRAVRRTLLAGNLGCLLPPAWLAWPWLVLAGPSCCSSVHRVRKSRSPTRGMPWHSLDGPVEDERALWCSLWGRRDLTVATDSCSHCKSITTTLHAHRSASKAL